jgi:hypothetical protein
MPQGEILSSLSYSLCPANVTSTLCVEGERSTDLVGGLIEFLGIEGCTESKSDTGAEEDVVGDSRNTTVINLDLFVSVRKFQNRIEG